MLELKSTFEYFLRPVEIIRNYSREDLRPDFVAGLTVTVILLPQAIAYALVAGLPVEMGLYAGIVGSIVGAMWGSSNHMQTGPSNTASLLVLSVLLTVAEPGTSEFIAAAGLITVMVGLFRLVVGLARLGLLVNFVSDSVVVGFTAGTGLLIAINQAPHIFRIDIESSPLMFVTIVDIISSLPQLHLLSVMLGGGAVIFLLIIRYVAPRLPGPLLVVIIASVLVAVLDLGAQGVQVVGELPQSLPPLTMVPLFDLDLIGKLSTGALAIAAIGLVEAASISRAIASQTGQRLDSNQEFVGQGLANIACGFFSGYSGSASFARSAANYSAGGRTPMANVFCGLIVLVILMTIGPLGAYLPRSAVAGVIVVAAINLVDVKEITRIWRSTRGDTLIMVGTLGATLLLPLEFAVLAGILISFARYILKTSLPSVDVVLPNATFDKLEPNTGRSQCPQLGIIDIRGDLYFGAVGHVEDVIRDNMGRYPEQQYLLLRLRSVNQCDISGIHMLETITRLYRDRGGDVYMIWVQDSIRDFMEASGFANVLGKDHILPEGEAISHIFYRVLDPAVCIYECEVRAFKECQNLPKPNINLDIPLHQSIPDNSVPMIDPQTLWERLHTDSRRYVVVDVREPREYRRMHIPNSRLLPLGKLLEEGEDLPHHQEIIFVCRTSRRSTRAAFKLMQQGYTNVTVLDGGITAWDKAGLLAAVERDYWSYEDEP